MQNEILESIRRALDEDIRTGDVTTNSIIPADALMNGKIIAKQDGVVAGLDIARAVLRMLDDRSNSTYLDEGSASPLTWS